jgi:hypothetical protein
MRTFVLRSSLLLFIALPLAGQTADWQQYENKEGNFTALFPGQPDDSVNKSDETVRSHTLLAKEDSAAYMVVYSTMAAAQKVDDDTYEIFKKAVFNELPKCAVESEQEPSPALNGYIGHWYRLSCDMPNAKKIVEGNLYWGKRYAYAVMVMFPASVDRPQTEKKFLESFTVPATTN